MSKEITFSGHYKADKMDSSILTFAMPLNLDVGDLANKKISAKLINLDCKYSGPQLVRPTFSIGMNFSKMSDVVCNWYIKDMIPLNDSLTWPELFKKFNDKYKTVWQDKFKYWPGDRPPIVSIEEHDDETFIVSLHVPPQVAITFKNPYFIGKFLGLEKHFEAFKRTFGPGIGSSAGSFVQEYVSKNESGKYIVLTGEPIPMGAYTPLKWFAKVVPNFSAQEVITIHSGIISLLQDRFLNLVAPAPFESTAPLLANFMNNSISDVLKFFNLPTSLLRVLTPSPDTLDIRMTSQVNLFPIEGLSLTIRLYRQLAGYDPLMNALQPPREELTFDLGTASCFLFTVPNRGLADPLSGFYPITILAPANASSTVARSFVHGLGSTCVLGILDQFGKLRSENFPLSANHRIQFQISLLDVRLRKLQLPADVDVYVKILFKA